MDRIGRCGFIDVLNPYVPKTGNPHVVEQLTGKHIHLADRARDQAARRQRPIVRLP